MHFTANFFKSLIRLVVGLAVLTVAAGIPAYFVNVDKEAVLASSAGKSTAADVANLYFDGGKISAAALIAESSGFGLGFEEKINAAYAEHPRWRAGGGDEPFFETFYYTIPNQKNYASFYEVLSTFDNRRRLSGFLAQSSSGLVKKILALKDLNTVLLPPAYSSAGAPMEAAILASALLAQGGDFSPDFLKNLSFIMDGARENPEKKEQFEKYCMGLLSLASGMDWTQLRAITPHFNSVGQLREFAKIYAAADEDRRDIFAAALLVDGNAEKCIAYMNDADDEKWADLGFALMNGEGAVDFLLNSGKPVYRDSRSAAYIAPATDRIKAYLGGFAAAYPHGALTLKILLVLFGGYMFARGLVRMFTPRRDTPSWYSPLALLRGGLEAFVVGVAFFAAFEPDAFKIKYESKEPPAEITFTFDQIINTLGEETMKFNTDSTTLAVIATFFVVQTTIYVFCLIRLSNIRRNGVPPLLKLKLLENDENLFDLCLYTGLAGTASSLILLSMNLISASLMAAYTSTLMGILYTALIKVVHVRRYRSKLLLEVAREEGLQALSAQKQ